MRALRRHDVHRCGRRQRPVRRAKGIRARPWYGYRTCSADPSPIRLGTLRVNVEHGVSALSRADMVIISSRGRPPPAPVLLAALQRAYQRGARMVSFCTGAYLLAEAALLDGRPATTLWTHADRFRARLPAVKLDPSVLYVGDGQVLTSAGNSAAADLARAHPAHRSRGGYCQPGGPADGGNTAPRRRPGPVR